MTLRAVLRIVRSLVCRADVLNLSTGARRGVMHVSTDCQEFVVTCIRAQQETMLETWERAGGHRECELDAKMTKT